jgi:PAS domain S-box-containing protein
MKLQLPKVFLLKGRVTLFTLGIIALTLVLLGGYATRTMHRDLETLVGEQQFSTATIFAQEINQDIKDRKLALEQAATQITPEIMKDLRALQVDIESQHALLELFNSGVFVTNADGTAVADAPGWSERLGINVMDRDYIIAALKKGRTAVGRPVLSKNFNLPTFSMATPIRDPQGAIMGALVGVTSLGKTNFMEKITNNRYGKTGGYLVVAKSSRQIVMATNKNRIMEVLPAIGVNPAIDRYIDGYEGAAVATTPSGIEMLSAAKAIPEANWYLVVLLPSSEAFGPVHVLLQRIWAAAGLAMVLAGLAVWWMLRQQLTPLQITAKSIADFPDTQQFPNSLPVSRDDEIGQLIKGFNQLLGTLRQRNSALRESEQRFRTLIEWTPEAIAVHSDGKMLFVNPAAVRMLGAASAQEIVGKPIMDLVHPDFREIVRARVQSSREEGVSLPTLEEKFQKVDGSTIDVEVTGMLISYEGRPAHQVAMRDITERKRADEALQSTLREKMALLNEVHHRVKNNLQVISSLLRLEASRSAQPDTRNVLQEMQGRIRSMALLHETLYRSGTFAAVDLGGYLKQLATEAFRAQASSHSAVVLKLELASIQVSMDLATPCGLLTNELISNCLKHAFPDGRGGEVRVELQVLPALANGATPCRLTVSDSGVGLPKDWETRSSQSLGLQLVSDLSRQIGAQLSIKLAPGSEFALSFNVERSHSGVSPV